MNNAPASALGFAPITPQRAFEEIANQIRELVASGKLKPGDRLPAERELSAKFNVSRNTLREALRALELSGMIELRKGATGGAFVLPGSSGVIVNGLRDLYHLGAITPQHLTEARTWISGIVVRVACERLTEEDLQKLEANVAAAAQAQKAGNFEERAELHRQFHILLAEATHNPIIMIAVEGMSELMRQFIKAIGPSENAYTLPSRRRLLKHLRDRDADAAEQEMTKFLERLEIKYLDLWNSRAKH
ncbi:FadR/GntR family transcriptional regulator [Hydrogenophaga sp. IBVHS1]|jgi:DNA-binding FadR family transcriptional regulator|uniref:FadR/GntR family transcriptional regulator n=1 Tax=unclassified Hydrogenophaga TaxID=2610897 RepID=UPI000A2E5160|nr:FadR/GntR family transcriptional regulator [Hydrogenophaga sp. IBVHS1]OSZ74744.1 GntR family transcriptional regulator [Hydrogenophaga sp. IBVHS1]